MPSGIRKPVTPLQAQMFGHVAAALRQAVKAKGWTPGDFNEALGIKRTNTAIYGWLRGTVCPGPTQRERIAQVTGLPEAALKPRQPGAGPGAAQEAPQALVIHPTANKRGRPPGPVTALVATAAQAPSFTFTLEGTEGPVTVQVTLGRKA